MKKLIRIPLILILVCCLSCSFLAAGVLAASDAISINTRFDIENSMLYVEGTVQSAKGNLPMVLKVEHEGALVAADQLYTGRPNNGTIDFVFSGIPFSGATPSGEYNIYVSAAFINEEATATYEYVGPNMRYALVEAINNAIDDNDANSLMETIEEYKGMITNGDDTVFSLSAGKSVFAKRFIAMGGYELPEGYESAEDIDTLTESIREIAANFKEALCIAEAADISSKADVSAWLDKYADDKGVFEDDPETDYNEAELKEYFDQALSSNGIASRIASAAKKATDFAELKDGIVKAGVVELLESGKAYAIKDVVESNPDLIPIDERKFNQLDDIGKTYIYNELTKLNFSSIEDFVEQFDKTVKDYLDKEDDKDDNTTTTTNKKKNNGGTGSGSVKSIDSGAANSGNGAGSTNPNAASSTGVGGFSDLEDCEWVKPAVSYLGSKGVVSGKGANIFDPYTPVTRAEFTKMVVLAFGIGTIAYDGSFSDVSDSDWFAPYVAAAYKAGVVNGIGEGKFDPYSQITRQDMAVLLYRAKGMSPCPEEKDVYYDSAYISDYAKSAVFALYFNGIALGYGDGNFGPLNNATRAEAAQMIYKLVTFDK